MDLHAAIRAAWNDHGEDAEGVAARLPEMAAAASAADVPALAGLVVHVLGEHLARWDDGLSLLGRLAEAAGEEAPKGPLLRSRAALELCAGRPDAASADLEAAVAEGGPPASSDARVHAVAASAVAAHGRVEEAGRWLDRAAEQTRSLPDEDPAVKAVAITANNLACALEERTDRGPADDALLRRSARLARVEWERAGTWVHVERAEYRLAMTHIALGEPAVALEHASACASICEENGADAGERFFACEVVTRARAAAGDVAGARAARDEAEALLAEVDDGLKGYATSVLKGLDTALG